MLDIYQLKASCSNNSSTHTFLFLPENFKGVKIAQKFSFQPPLGYTPKFSIETIRAVLGDRIYLNGIFDTYGKESDITIQVFKLNSTADEYVLNSTFSVDIESYEKKSLFSEFALKSVSCLDDYNEIKNTETQFTGTTNISFPVAKKYINHISIKKLSDRVSSDDETLDINTAVLEFEPNEDSKIYNYDTALAYDEINVYEFHRSIVGSTDMVLSVAGTLNITCNIPSSTTILTVKLYKNDFSTPIYQFYSGEVYGSGYTTISIDVPKTKLLDIDFVDADVWFVGIELDDATNEILEVSGTFFLDLYVDTEVAANRFSRNLTYLGVESVLNTLFSGYLTLENSLKSLAVTSAQTIINSLSYVSIVPKDFLYDFCIANGALVNFKIGGVVEIQKISTYFTALLDVDNAIEVTIFKDLSISFDTELLFKSVSVGMEQKQYDIYTYFIDWMKVLTFSQPAKKASENLELTLAKYRCDFSGILDFVEKIANNESDNSKDMFLFNPTLTARTTNEVNVYDVFTPRDILENWRKFLEFIFYNYSRDTLEISSNGGTPDELTIDSIGQMDDFVFTGDGARILPLKVNMTCLIQNIDFTESILKVTYQGEEMFIFITEAETTDKLIEQKIKGNLIYFPS